LERNIALAFDGVRKNDWTRGPVTVHLLDLGTPEACVYSLVLERRGACAVQMCRPRISCSDPNLRALCFHVCVKTDGAESRVLPRTYNDIGAESSSRPSPCRHGLRWAFSECCDSGDRFSIGIRIFPIFLIVSETAGCVGGALLAFSPCLTLNRSPLDPDPTNGSPQHTTQLRPRRRPRVTWARSDISFRLGIKSSPACEDTPCCRRPSSCMYGYGALGRVSTTARQFIPCVVWPFAIAMHKARLVSQWY